MDCETRYRQNTRRIGYIPPNELFNARSTLSRTHMTPTAWTFVYLHIIYCVSLPSKLAEKWEVKQTMRFETRTPNGIWILLKGAFKYISLNNTYFIMINNWALCCYRIHLTTDSTSSGKVVNHSCTLLYIDIPIRFHDNYIACSIYLKRIAEMRRKQECLYLVNLISNALCK